MNEPHPTLEEVRALLADADVVPVVAQLPIDDATPVDAMAAMGVDASCFLLESVGGSGKVARWSLLGHNPSRMLHIAPALDDPLLALARDVTAARVARVDGLSLPFTGGAVGYLGYEAARRYERLPIAARDPLGVPDAWFAVFPTVVVFDHAQHKLVVVSNVAGDDVRGVDAAYADAVTQVRRMQQRLAALRPSAPRPRRELVETGTGEPPASMSRGAFQRAMQRCLEYIVAGDIFQVQISRRFAVPLVAHPFELYKALRAINPSPYMFYLATPECTLVGASPEMLVRVTGSRVQYRPIAGTRRRGRTPEDDERMEAELRGNEKERAEHLMLVDLGRNDLGRVCATGSVLVTQMMEVERYSHVMHLVSSIDGRLRDGCTSLDALRACFPAGTVTGAPKIRAMEIIAELEPEVRGPYAGVVGYVAFGGDLDTAIALRTIVVRNRMAYVQAAAGIVADSNPHDEALEIDNKVQAPLLAIAEANSWSTQ